MALVNKLRARLAHIGVVLALFVVLTVAYSLATPVFEKPDEPAHFAYIAHLADGLGFPGAPISLSEDAPAQESSQPPVYYTTAALFVRVLAPEANDWHSRLERNPTYPYMGRESHNDNKNVFVHSTLDVFPFQDTARAVHVARLVALLFGVVTVYATYRLSLEIYADRRDVALLAAGVVAFMPQFVFISGAASNDSTAAALCVLALWATVRIMRRGFSLRRAVLLGVLLGLAALSKTSALGLWPIALLAIALWRTDRQPRFVTRVIWSVGVLLIALGLSGPWYIRSLLVFDDLLGISTHMLTPWARSAWISLTIVLRQLPSALNSWWLAFGWGDIVAAPLIYWVLDAVALLGFSGAAYWFARARNQRLARWGTLMLAAWMMVIVIAFIRWNQLLAAALGRLLFPAIGAAAILIALGWVTTLRRWAIVPALGILALSIAALPLWLTPAYARPALLTESDLMQQPGQSSDVGYGDVARLVRVDAPRTPWPKPGDEPAVRLCWQPLRQDDRPLMVLVQIVGAENRVVATRRTLPGLGSYPVSAWQPGAIFCDVMHVAIDDDAPAPGLYQVEVSIIDTQTRERLPAYDAAGVLLTTNFVDRMKIAPQAYRTPSIEQPLSYRLGDQFELIGYNIDRTAVSPGGGIGLRLYWQALRQPDADYTVFAQLRAADNQIVAQKDGAPQSGAYPTSFWEAGEVVIDDRVIEIPAAAPGGTFPIKVGMYLPAAGSRLSIDGNPAVNEITLPVEVTIQR
jgi:hypothetical protein